MKLTFVAVVSIAAGLSVVPANAQPQRMVYPAQGQTFEMQQQDEAACSTWAVQTSGFDPARIGPAPVSTDRVTGSGSIAGGAIAGAAIAGASGGNAGTGAAVGAVTGGVTRRARNRSAANSQQRALDEQQRAGMEAFDRARVACLTGRGYTVQ